MGGTQAKARDVSTSSSGINGQGQAETLVDGLFEPERADQYCNVDVHKKGAADKGRSTHHGASVVLTVSWLIHSVCVVGGEL